MPEAEALDNLRLRIDKAGLGQHAEALLSVASPAIRLSPRRMEDDGPLGVSRLGGLPDLPPGIAWPMVDNILLEFVGQFRLAELVSHNVESRLPTTGMLYFFFDGMLTGYDRGEAKDRCAVLYYDGPIEALERRELPAHNHAFFDIFYPCALECETAWTLPPLQEIGAENDFFPPVKAILGGAEEREAYRKQLRPREFYHQLLGHPMEVQGGEMRLQVIKAQDAKGRFASDQYGNYKRRDELIDEMRQWRLLAQFKSDQPTGMDWGCGGMIYFWMREADLIARRFDRVFGKLESS